LAYGIRISNANGEPVMETDDSGELWLKNRLRVGTSDTSTVEIGYSPSENGETTVFKAYQSNEDGNIISSFTVYENGIMNATGASFSGYIEATGGSIGPVILSKENGITVTNSGFKILKTTDKGLESVLYSDADGLHITGDITATSGSFTGTINATSATF
jgi:hypothetical protein